MSQNALLDRETLTARTGRAGETETQPVARLQREHLTLIDWDASSPDMARAGLVGMAAVVIPARRRWFGWSEAATGLLLLAAGAACLSSLLRF